MATSIKVREIVIGEGIPKICIPIMGETEEQLLTEAQHAKEAGLDILEWRADFFPDIEDMEKVVAALEGIRLVLPEVPLIFTFRSAKEGGEKDISPAFYFELNRAVAATGKVDFIDIELFNEESRIRETIDFAHDQNVRVIVSNHDFHQTPPKEEMIARLRKAEALGADLPKIAVMPKSAADVLALLDATRIVKEEYASQPLITMAMAGTGVISRLAGEIFGSAVTFGSAKKASAPGQVSAAELRSILALLHGSLQE